VRRLGLFVLVGLLLCGSGPSAASEALRVLFVGNSLTYYNNMPVMVEAIAAANPGRPAVTTRLHASGGRELVEALEIPELVALVRDGGWDFVVLQEQSRLGSTTFVNGRNVVVDPEPFFRATRSWNRLITESGARPVLLASWLDRGEATREWEMVGWSYRAIGVELGVPVIGADLAWITAEESHPELDLYDADGLHPNPVGSLLTALLVYAELLDVDDLAGLGLPAVVRGPYVEPGDGTIQADRIVDLGRFNPGAIRWVREIASASLQRSFASKRPAPPDPPKLPAAFEDDAGPQRFAGRWQGEAKHYPDFLPWPGRMRLDLAVGTDGDLSGRMSITFDGSKFEVDVTLDRVELADGRIVFVDHDGPEDAPVRYEGVLADDDRLIGVASLVSEDASLAMTGEWSLERVRSAPD
jgi:hypothetical protein